MNDHMRRTAVWVLLALLVLLLSILDNVDGPEE